MNLDRFKQDNWFFFPTWLITRIMWRWLPADHPFKRNRDKMIPYKDWAEHATAMNFDFCFILWITSLMTIVLAAIIWIKHR